MLRGAPELTYYGYNDDKLTGKGPSDPANKFGLQGHYVPDTDSFRPIADGRRTPGSTSTSYNSSTIPWIRIQ